MTETSRFFGGTTLGDATDAPYDEAEFYQAINSIYGCSFVVPGYLNNLNLTGATLFTGNYGDMTIDTGAALVHGVVYEKDSERDSWWTVSAAVNNRYDRVVLRRNDVTNEVRVVVLEGVEAADPELPPIGTYDLPLWHYYVPAGFVPHVLTNILPENMHDERVFNHPALMNERFNFKNLMHNSEFMAYGQADDGLEPPDMWDQASNPPVLQGTTALSRQHRGWGVEFEFQAGSVDELQTWINIPYEDIESGGDTVFTIIGLLKVTQGGVHLQINDNASYQRDYYRRGAGGEEIVFMYRYEEGFSGLSDGIKIELQNIAATAVAAQGVLGQIMVVKGYMPGPFRQKREIIMCNAEIVDAAWDQTAKSSTAGVGTQIDLSADFGGNIRRSTRAILARVRGRDSGSAAGAPYMYTVNYDKVASGDYCPSSWVSLEGVVNDIERESWGLIGIHNGANYGFVTRIIATGALTFDASIYINGLAI